MTVNEIIKDIEDIDMTIKKLSEAQNSFDEEGMVRVGVGVVDITIKHLNSLRSYLLKQEIK